MQFIPGRWRIWCFVAAVLLVSPVFWFCTSCSHYRFGTTLPEGCRAIEVMPVENLTGEAALEGLLRNSLAERLMQTPGVALAKPNRGDAQLETKVAELEQSRVSRAKLRAEHDRDHTDAAYQTVVFRLEIQVEYRLVAPDGQALREGKVNSQADFPTLSDLEIARKEALRELMRSAAAQIVAEVTEE